MGGFRRSGGTRASSGSWTRTARFDDTGVSDGSWCYPNTGIIAGSAIAMRAMFAEDALMVGLVGQDSYPIGGGHINTFDYIEISIAAYP